MAPMSLTFLYRSTLVAVFAVALGAAPVQAQGNADSEHAELDEAARVLFDQGTRAYDSGNFELALERFETAYELSERPQLLYNIAVAHDRLDHKAEALGFYERFLEALPQSSRAELASSRAAVLRRSTAADAAAEAAADAAREAEARRAAEEAAATDSATATADEANAELAVTEEEASGGSLAGPIASFGVAGAGLVTFAVAGIITMGRHGDCEDNGCTADDLDAVDRSALIADIGLGVAIAGAATGLILLLTRDSGEEENTSSATLVPTVTTNSAGLFYRSSF